MNPEFEIQGRKIGIDYDPLVIAEIGINHEGNLETALAMVDAAIEAGAEVVKHQTHIVEDEMSVEARDVVPGNADVSIYEIMERCALNEDEERKLKEYVESRGAIFLSTPFSRQAALRLERLGVHAYKVGSGECNNHLLLELIAGFGKPVILSTGMNDIDTVAESVAILRRWGIPFCLMHCTNVYPTPDSLVRLGAVQELQWKFPDAVVGLSDHSVDKLACLGAVALGASVLERHFTDSKKRPGPDISCSMDGPECAELIEASRRLKAMRGGTKTPVPEENPTKKFAFASMVSTTRIERGDIFTLENVWARRPATGEISVRKYQSVLGEVAACDIPADTQLRWEHIESE